MKTNCTIDMDSYDRVVAERDELASVLTSLLNKIATLRNGSDAYLLVDLLDCFPEVFERARAALAHLEVK